MASIHDSLVSQGLWTEGGEHAQCLVGRLVRSDDQEREEVSGGSPSSIHIPRPLQLPPRLGSPDELTYIYIYTLQSQSLHRFC